MLKCSIRKIFHSACIRARSRIDYVKSYDAMDINYERHGFRKIGSQVVDTSAIVNSYDFNAYKKQYSVPAPLEKNLLQKLLASKSVDELNYVLSENVEDFMNLGAGKDKISSNNTSTLSRRMSPSSRILKSFCTFCQ